MTPSIWTIGYGNLPLATFLERLAEEQITHLVDVRTNPVSSYMRDYDYSNIKQALAWSTVKYLYMGDRLGGKPNDASLTTEGRPDYEKIRADPRFLIAIAKVIEAATTPDRHICLMCGCSRPESCHRSTLLGEALAEKGAEMRHICPDRSILGQKEVMALRNAGQSNLFDA